MEKIMNMLMLRIEEYKVLWCGERKMYCARKKKKIYLLENVEFYDVSYPVF